MTDLASYQTRINEKLDAALTGPIPDRLLSAMRYSALGGGKRVRPCLVYLAAEAAGADLEAADSTACAVELIHAYSLIHDDLPSMDNDELRRGQPTCHIIFDEATAILAGDALQTLAFELLASDAGLSPQQRLAIIQSLSKAAGAAGMVGGQAIDLASENQTIAAETLIDMHRRKTGALISTSVVCGAICGNASDTLLAAMSDYGYALGLAFQVRDDILDETGETSRIGKTAGSDSRQQKSTFISAYGLGGSNDALEQLRQQALAALAPLGSRARGLTEMAEFIAKRDH